LQFRRTTTVTSEYATLFHRSTKGTINPTDAKQKLDGEVAGSLLRLQDGRYRLTLLNLRRQVDPIDEETHIFDGREYRSLQRATHGDPIPGSMQIGRETREYSHERSCFPLTLLPGLQENLSPVALADAAIPDPTLVEPGVVNFTAPWPGGNSKATRQRWVLNSKDVALREIHGERRDANNGKWSDFLLVQAKEYSRVGGVIIPIRFEESIFTSSGLKSQTAEIVLTSLTSLNAVADREFELDVEKGTNVVHADGHASVFGDGPSDRLLNSINEKAKRELQELKNVTQRFSNSPYQPADVFSAAGLILVVLGFGLLLGAGVLWVSRSFLGKGVS
jgi:hypothetical protein